MPNSATPRRPTVVVIGASAAGLFVAAALAEFADVEVIERDTLPKGPEPRRGVPQARHAHVVWSGGVRAFNDLLPGLTDDIVARGGRMAHIMGDMVSRSPNGVWFRRFRSTHHRNVVCSRDLLDAVIRDRVLTNARITIRDKTTALSLEGTATQVTGLRVRTGEETFAVNADLVVDASGRGSHALQWLVGLGLPRATEREVNPGVTYATRLYKAPSRVGSDFPLINVQANPRQAPGRGGIILPIENNQWLVTLGGTRGGEPTADPDAFAAFALGFDHPVIGELLEKLEPISDIVTTRGTASRRRYYEKAKYWPDGFIVIGDAVATYNPVYGHGLTVAAQSATAVRDVLRSTGFAVPGTARRLQRAASRPVAAAWDLAVGQDAFYPGATDTPPTSVEKLLARFVDRAVATGARNPRAMRALLDVMSMEKPATRLLSPDMLIPMLFGPKRPHLQGPPLTDREREAATS
ncbi:FAD-dependent oxidoreductase [Streptomyces acidicola]|uniref:Pyridine nucleotide-disulfide oxidoreductase n=1 Tax=Streptomyces acidicola TaxID=2596892 RepID=A0A5N8WKI8_9ACTN|nr:FAD-dependent monooxygenase [Streptomyces acidicola]MPY47737.1 pyridine nucleotide-disulfide oxidoreductase [Streptomyces acidicola]